jgi:hypothetical protein
MTIKKYGIIIETPTEARQGKPPGVLAVIRFRIPGQCRQSQ